MKTKCRCDIIIPVCNKFAYTRLCLGKLLQNTDIFFNLVLIDNGSADRTQKFFMDFSSPNLNLIYLRNEDNKGPIVAYNQGIKLGKSDYVCLMHNDVLIFEKGWLSTILDLMDENKDIGIIGLAGRKSINKKGLVDESTLVHNLRNEDLNEIMRKSIEEVAVIDGLCFIVRRKILSATEGLDEAYGYMHCYDLDISMASIDLGYCNVVARIDAMHISNGGITRRTPSYRSLVKDDYSLLNVNYKKFSRKWRKLLPRETF